MLKSMLSNKKRDTTPKEEPFKKALDWETSKTELIEKSERTAWNVAKGASIIAILAIVAIVLLIPLKESIPYVVRIDKNTGYTDIVTTLQNKNITYDEVTDKYWLSQFVSARETWEWYTAQKDYDAVRLLSSAEVGRDYVKIFEGPNALDKLYGQGSVVTVEIRTIVPQGNGQASVRFDKKLKRRDSPDATSQVTSWIATIGYEYKKISKMKESERLKNPLGFQVLSYRLDSEMAGDKVVPEVQKQTEAVKVPAPVQAGK